MTFLLNVSMVPHCAPVFAIFPTHVFSNFLKPVTAISLVMGQNVDNGFDADTGLLPTYWISVVSGLNADTEMWSTSLLW